MGIFGFLAEVTTAVVKVAATPIATAKDVVDVAMGEEAENTGKLIESAGKSFNKSFDKLTEEL